MFILSTIGKLERPGRANTAAPPNVRIDFPALHVNLGLIYQRMKQYSLAQKEFLDALSADQSNTSARYYLGIR